MSDPETAQWLDGPGFAEWLEERGIEASHLRENSDSLCRWRQGRKVSIWRADEILTHFGYHIRELPSELWTESPYGHIYPDDLKQRVAELRSTGLGCKRVGQLVGVDAKTIRYWEKAA